jgi:archaellum biogenesis ATPase FlaH
MNKIDYIKKRLSAIEYMRNRGLPVSTSRNIKCPLGTHEDKNPSFSFFDGGEKWKCFSCGETGDVIDIAEKVGGESMDDLFFRLGGKNDFAKKLEKQQEKADEAKEYLAKRKVDIEAIRGIIGYENGMITLPIVNQYGDTVGIQRRSLTDKRFLIDGESGFFWNDPNPKGVLMIAEGVMDYLTLRQFYPHVLGLVSATSSLECSKILKRYEKVLWLGDNDKTGNEQKRKFLELQKECDIYDIERKTERDMNDSFCAFTGKNFIGTLLSNMKLIQEGEKVFASFSQIAEEALVEAGNTTEDKIISFGHKSLDDIIGGIFPQSLIVIGADTGAGKSQFLGNLAYKTAKQGKRVIYFDLENDNGDFVRRHMLKKLGERGVKVRMRDLRTLEGIETLGQNHGIVLGELEREIGDTLILYRNRKIPTIDDMLEYIRQVDNADLICIDHLHYFDLATDENQSSQIGKIMRAFRVITREKGIPIVTASHLRKRNKKDEPDNDDLFGSSNIAKEAETVILMWRDEEDGEYNSRVRVSKNRNESKIVTLNAKYSQEERDYIEITENQKEWRQNASL